MEVSETILRQLGGRQFIVMTGARNFIGHPDMLTFRLPGSGGFCKNGINRVAIRLNPSDTYTVTFSRIRGMKAVEIAEHRDVYFDSLQEIFTRETGLETHL